MSDESSSASCDASIDLWPCIQGSLKQIKSSIYVGSSHVNLIFHNVVPIQSNGSSMLISMAKRGETNRMTTEEIILAKYGGPLLSYDQVAELLHRSPGGLRITLCRHGELPEQLRKCRVRIGRRVLFRVSGLVDIVEGMPA